jgi:hypothetical protein
MSNNKYPNNMGVHPFPGGYHGQQHPGYPHHHGHPHQGYQYHPGYYHPHPGWQTGPVPSNIPAPKKGIVDFRDPGFSKGLLIGAVAAYLLSNEDVQRNLFKSTARVWHMARGGAEEMKERFQDAEAEIRMDNEES